MAEPTDTQAKIADQLERTNQLITRLENQRYLQMVDRPFKFLFMSFMQGIAIALGSTIGLAIVVGIVIYVLNKLQVFAPISQLLDNLQTTVQSTK